MIKFKNGTVRTLLYVILIIYSMSIFYPIFLMIITSLKENREIFTRPYNLPQTFNLDNYIQLFKVSNYLTYFRNSIVVTIISLLIILALSSLASYALAMYLIL